MSTIYISGKIYSDIKFYWNSVSSQDIAKALRRNKFAAIDCNGFSHDLIPKALLSLKNCNYNVYGIIGKYILYQNFRL